MSRPLFQAIGAALWGPQYRSEMARQLGVHLRTLMRWDRGERPIPAHVRTSLVVLLVERASTIGRLLQRVRQ